MQTSPELAKYLADDLEAQQRSSPYTVGGSLALANSPSHLPFLDVEITEEDQIVRLAQEHPHLIWSPPLAIKL